MEGKKYSNRSNNLQLVAKRLSSVIRHSYRSRLREFDLIIH